MSPLTAVLNFIPPTATGVRPVRSLSRHFGCAVVRGVLGLTEPTAFIEFEFFTSVREGILSSVSRDFEPTLTLQAQFPSNPEKSRQGMERFIGFSLMTEVHPLVSPR